MQVCCQQLLLFMYPSHSAVPPLCHLPRSMQTAFLTTVDPHTSPRLRDRFGISHLPTLLLFRDRKVGLRGQDSTHHSLP